MMSIGLFEAKTRLSEICEQVSLSGQAVLITRRGKPLVRIDPLREETLTIRERRARYLSKEGDLEDEDAADFEPPARSREVRDYGLDG